MSKNTINRAVQLGMTYSEEDIKSVVSAIKQAIKMHWKGPLGTEVIKTSPLSTYAVQVMSLLEFMKVLGYYPVVNNHDIVGSVTGMYGFELITSLKYSKEEEVTPLGVSFTDAVMLHNTGYLTFFPSEDEIFFGGRLSLALKSKVVDAVGLQKRRGKMSTNKRYVQFVGDYADV